MVLDLPLQLHANSMYTTFLLFTQLRLSACKTVRCLKPKCRFSCLVVDENTSAGYNVLFLCR